MLRFKITFDDSYTVPHERAKLVRTHAQAEQMITEISGRWEVPKSSFEIESEEIDSTLFITNAPKSYDYSSTRYISYLKDEYRLVDIPDKRLEYQLGRYGSGLHGYFKAGNEAELKDHGIDISMIKDDAERLHSAV